MNTKAKEKVDNSTELFRQKQAEMSDKQLIELAEKQVTELARTGGRSHKMCVPPQTTDTDMLFSELIRRFKLRCDGQPVADTESGLHLHNVSGRCSANNTVH